jgi:hypothetical protein
MKRIFNIIAISTAIFATSCIQDGYLTEVNNDFKVNYETFWNLFNENYCFMGENFGYTKNVDWKAVYDEMMPKVEAAETEEELLEIMGQSIDKLKDGHIWIDTKFNHRGCFTFYYDQNGVKYPDNFISNTVIKEKYLDDKYQYRTRNGQRFGNITRNGKTFFYLYHSDFTKDLTAEDLKVMQPHIEKADGFIYDIRTNLGGNTQLAFDIAGKFMKEKTHVGYDVVKTGKGYNDMTDPAPLYVVPKDQSLKWSEKKTVLLTNRDVYSTANEFACFMKEAPNVTLIGGITGGGGGNPTSYYLPNGWTVVMSAHTFTLDKDKKQIEAGIEPDIEVTITETDKANNVDSILERAIEELSK